MRQISVGHENDPEVGWVRVPDFKTLDPIESGLLPAGTDPSSPEFFAAYQHVIYDYYQEMTKWPRRYRLRHLEELRLANPRGR